MTLMRKKIITIVIILIFICASSTSCLFSENDSEQEVQTAEKLNQLYQELLSAVPDTSDIESQHTYLIGWASTRNIPLSYDNYGNLIMSVQATEGYQDVPATVLHCGLGQGIAENHYQALATVLYIMEYTQNHGFIRAIFTSGDGENFRGAENIALNYIKADRLINLTHDTKTVFTIGSAGKRLYEFSRPLSWEAPSNTVAYEISISGLKSESSGLTNGKHPNPIKTIGDFLAFAKSKGMLIELAAFNGGEHIDSYPSQATATVVIHENDASRFEKWFEKDSTKFLDKYSSLNDPVNSIHISYNMTPVNVPELTISKEDSTKIFSLLYTMINGVFMKNDEGDLLATSTIGTISTSSGELDLGICGRSIDKEILSNMDSTFEVICGLNDSKYSKLSDFPIWQKNEKSHLLDTFTDLFKREFNKKVKNKTVLMNTECALFKSRNPELDVISMSVNFENKVTEVLALQQLLTSTDFQP